WARYDQLVVKNFNAGGMENTAATTMYPTAILDERALLDGDLEGLISHELAHQWTGDLITCRSWEHLWLNEGWATFGESLWLEHRDGPDGYLDDIRSNFRVARRDRTTDELPMVSPVYADPDDTFGRRANPYSKGASVLHMLRMMLGEEVFWKGVQLYMGRHVMGLVETSDLRYAMEAVSGLGLEWFFQQWCYRPGCPNLEVEVEYLPASRELMIDVVQAQEIDRRTPAMRFVLPVHVRTGTEWSVHEIEIRERTTSFRTVLEGVPTVVAVDPYLHVLKTIEEDKPLSLWLVQAEHGPTIAARHDAVAALGDVDASETIELLARIVGDEGERYTLRRTAVGALRGLGSEAARTALRRLVEAEVADARVRSELTRSARGLEKQDVLDVLVRRAGEDESYATRVAAIDALASHQATEHADLIAELVHYDSQHQQVRGAALRALARLEDPRGLDLAMQYAAFGNEDRARSTAIGVIADLAEHDRERAATFLLELLDDPEQRARRAAIRALGAIGDERARDPLRAIADSHRDPAFRATAERALQRMEEE
ncbi:MAG: M1 family aminopeptidase, partial [Planctomycetota bacterium]